MENKDLINEATKRLPYSGDMSPIEYAKKIAAIAMEWQRDNTGDKPKDNRSVTERIKTFDDALNELGESNGLVQEYRQFCTSIKCFSKDLEAYLKLRIITAALNEGWKPKFVKNERRYFPWYYICIDECMSCAVAYDDSSDSSATLGSHLCFRTKELAEYAGKQFIDLYAQMMGVKEVSIWEE